MMAILELMSRAQTVTLLDEGDRSEVVETVCSSGFIPKVRKARSPARIVHDWYWSRTVKAYFVSMNMISTTKIIRVHVSGLGGFN